MITTSTIIQRYRQQHGLSLRDFAELLSENLGESISHQTIKNWEDGSIPGYFILLVLLLKHTDWRRDLALECLQVLKPELYGELPHPEDAQPVPVIYTQERAGRVIID